MTPSSPEIYQYSLILAFSLRQDISKANFRTLYEIHALSFVNDGIFLCHTLLFFFLNILFGNRSLSLQDTLTTLLEIILHRHAFKTAQLLAIGIKENKRRISFHVESLVALGTFAMLHIELHTDEMFIHVSTEGIVREDVGSHVTTRSTPKGVAIYHQLLVLLLSLCQSLGKGALEELGTLGIVLRCLGLLHKWHRHRLCRCYRNRQHQSGCQRITQNFLVHSSLLVLYDLYYKIGQRDTSGTLKR